MESTKDWRPWKPAWDPPPGELPLPVPPPVPLPAACPPAVPEAPPCWAAPCPPVPMGGLPGQLYSGLGFFDERLPGSSRWLVIVRPFWSLISNSVIRTLNHSPQLEVWKYGASPAGSEHRVVARLDRFFASVPDTESRDWRSASMFERFSVRSLSSSCCTSAKSEMNLSMSPVIPCSRPPTEFRSSRICEIDRFWSAYVDITVSEELIRVLICWSIPPSRP